MKKTRVNSVFSKYSAKNMGVSEAEHKIIMGGAHESEMRGLLQKYNFKDILIEAALKGIDEMETFPLEKTEYLMWIAKNAVLNQFNASNLIKKILELKEPAAIKSAIELLNEDEIFRIAGWPAGRPDMRQKIMDAIVILEDRAKGIYCKCNIPDYMSYPEYENVRIEKSESTNIPDEYCTVIESEAVCNICGTKWHVTVHEYDDRKTRQWVKI